MQSEFIAQLNEHNLCTYYLLPLIGLNKFSFEDGNFIDSYVVKGGDFIMVYVVDINLCPHLKDHGRLVHVVHSTDHDELLFHVPGWADEFRKFEQGRYSEFSERAKKRIRLNSGLIYKKADPSHPEDTYTDVRLMALDKSAKLRDYWDTELGVTLSEHDELISKPKESCFIEFEW